MTRQAAALRCVGIALLLLVTAGPSALVAEPSRWTFRVSGLGTDYEKDLGYSYFSSTSRLHLGQGQGYEFAAELRQNRLLGWELAISQLELDARYTVTQLRPVSFDPLVFREETTFSSTGDFGIQPISLGLVLHPLERRHFGLYIAPQIAWVRFDPNIEGAQEREEELAFGGKIGAEFPLGTSPWSLGLELRHLEIQHESLDRDLYGNMGLDVGSLVFSYRVGSLPYR
jgi:hypothetical protein